MMKNKLNFWVGAFVLLGAAAFIFLVLQTSSASISGIGKSYTVTAYFDNVGGLKPRSPVKSSGVVIGRVRSIAYDSKQFRAKVELELDERYPFPKDSSLKILTSGLLGEQYLGLEAGADEANLAANDVIRTTQSAVVLENLISQFLYSKAQDGAASSEK